MLRLAVAIGVVIRDDGPAERRARET